ncbi:MAG: GNAT family N-acetyltransferase [Roseivirga sp.]
MSIFDSNIPTYFVDYERAEFIDWLDKQDRAPYYVLLEKDTIVAAGGIYIDDEKQVAGLAWGMVHRLKHKQGLGRILTQHRLKVMDEVYPKLDQQLATSQLTEAFYQKFGFETTERIKDGFGPGLDNCKMRKSSLGV